MIKSLGMQLLLSFVLTVSSWASEPPRLALVVGNSAYGGDLTLANPVNDATDVAGSLKKLGWQVTLVTDADRRAMTKAINTFKDALSTTEGSTAMFYYAGHGVQMEGANYLVPVKADIQAPDDFKTEAISLTLLTDALEEAKAGVTLVVLDACRDNPFAKKMTRSMGATRGLTTVQKGGGVEGSAIIFSTSPGDTAQDGTGRNGVFTKALLHHLGDNAKLEDIIKSVTVEVRLVTGGVQKPWLNSSLSSDFYVASEALRAQWQAELDRQALLAKQADIDKAVAAAVAKTKADASAQALTQAETDKRVAEALAKAKATAEAQAVSQAQLAESLRKEKADAEAQAKAQADLATRLQQEKAQADAELASLKNQPHGKLRIESTEDGEVYVDSVLVGKVAPDSPLVMDNLVPGNKQVRFVGKETPETTKTAVVDDKVFVTLTFGKAPASGSSQIPGSLSVATNVPTAKASLDGGDEVALPHLFENLIPGIHSVEISDTTVLNYIWAGVKSDVNIEAGQEAKFHPELSLGSGTVKITGIASGTTLRSGDQVLELTAAADGTLEFNGTVDAGRRDFILPNPNGLTLTQSVTVGVGRSLELRVDQMVKHLKLQRRGIWFTGSEADFGGVPEAFGPEVIEHEPAYVTGYHILGAKITRDDSSIYVMIKYSDGSPAPNRGSGRYIRLQQGPIGFQVEVNVDDSGSAYPEIVNNHLKSTIRTGAYVFGKGIVEMKFPLDPLEKSKSHDGLDFSKPITANAITWDDQHRYEASHTGEVEVTMQ